MAGSAVSVLGLAVGARQCELVAAGLDGKIRPDCVRTFATPPGDPTTTPAVPGAFGTCSNGVIRGPRFADVDLSVLKGFHIGENKRIEFRSEFINLFNHPILNFAPGTGSFSLNSTQFGQINSSQGERNIQFGLKFYY